MSKYYFFLLPIFLISLTVYSQEVGLELINENDLVKNLTFIASDSLQGRELGTQIPGLDITADYLQNNAVKLGLAPGGDNYFQSINLVSSQVDYNESSLEVRNKKGKVRFRTNTFLDLSGGSVDFNLREEEIVVVGFGWQDSKTDYDDFAGIDVKDKIVLCTQGTPDSYGNEKSFRWNSRLERAKFETIFNKGAKAILLVTNPKDKKATSFNQIKGWMSRQKYKLQETPNNNGLILLTKPVVANQILGKKRKFENMLSSISKNNKPKSFLVEDFKLSVKLKYNIGQTGAKNVIAVVEGSDPVLKKECVVFMAHYDHLGVGKAGEVYNGADDNGTGTVTLMELAKAFQSLKEKPKRSVVFLWVTCEEIGMFGSNYYTQNPVFPLDETVACINLDMVGRVYEPRDSVWKRSPKLVKDFDGLYTLSGDFCPDLVEISDKACAKLGLVPDKSLPDNFLRSSDHYHFYKNGVPILNYATGYHADYHKVGDEVSKINFEKLKRVADLCFLVGYEVANREKRLEILTE